MSIFSVTEDFSCNTLGAIPGLLGKLSYVSRLKGADGEYRHWGLEKKYGEIAARKAMQDAQCDLAFRVLRLPMRELIGELESAASRDGISVLEYASRLAVETDRLLPEGASGAFENHFKIVLQSLLCLARGCTGANRQAS